MHKKLLIVLVLVGCCAPLFSMGKDHIKRPRDEPGLRAVVPIRIIPMCEAVAGSVAHAVYCAASDAKRNELARLEPVYNLVFCDNVSAADVSLEGSASKILELAFFFEDVAESLGGALKGFFKVKAGRAGERIVCTYDSDQKTVCIHEVSARDDA